MSSYPLKRAREISSLCAAQGCPNFAVHDGYCMSCNEEIEAVGLWYQEQAAKPKHELRNLFLFWLPFALALIAAIFYYCKVYEALVRAWERVWGIL